MCAGLWGGGVFVVGWLFVGGSVSCCPLSNTTLASPVYNISPLFIAPFKRFLVFMPVLELITRVSCFVQTFFLLLMLPSKTYRRPLTHASLNQILIFLVGLPPIALTHPFHFKFFFMSCVLGIPA